MKISLVRVRRKIGRVQDLADTNHGTPPVSPSLGKPRLLLELVPAPAPLRRDSKAQLEAVSAALPFLNHGSSTAGARQTVSSKLSKPHAVSPVTGCFVPGRRRIKDRTKLSRTQGVAPMSRALRCSASWRLAIAAAACLLCRLFS